MRILGKQLLANKPLPSVSAGAMKAEWFVNGTVPLHLLLENEEAVAILERYKNGTLIVEVADEFINTEEYSDLLHDIWNASNESLMEIVVHLTRDPDFSLIIETAAPVYYITIPKLARP